LKKGPRALCSVRKKRFHCVVDSIAQDKVVLKAIATGVAVRVHAKAAAQGDADVLLFPADAITSVVNDSTPNSLLVWLLLARYHGLVIAPPHSVGDDSALCIKFLPAKSRRRVLFLTTEFRETSSSTVHLLERLCSDKACLWSVVSERPAKCTSQSVVIHSLRDRRAVDGTMSFTSFLNLITFIDVQNSFDGVPRRGIVAKK
jgi:hypothetical protein